MHYSIPLFSRNSVSSVVCSPLKLQEEEDEEVVTSRTQIMRKTRRVACWKLHVLNVHSFYYEEGGGLSSDADSG